MKVYVASSWRNSYQPEVVKALRLSGHDVYDFCQPNTGGPQEQREKEMADEQKPTIHALHVSRGRS